MAQEVINHLQLVEPADSLPKARCSLHADRLKRCRVQGHDVLRSIRGEEGLGTGAARQSPAFVGIVMTPQEGEVGIVLEDDVIGVRRSKPAPLHLGDALHEDGLPPRADRGLEAAGCPKEFKTRLGIQEAHKGSRPRWEVPARFHQVPLRTELQPLRERLPNVWDLAEPRHLVRHRHTPPAPCLRKTTIIQMHKAEGKTRGNETQA
mmetsp:Transcript_11927/g.27964  ORF Transcript_11927/g.27964 Transcript_11927/m.27964 type:complete len:206 (-) Transcript_11927:86-703(-)